MSSKNVVKTYRQDQWLRFLGGPSEINYTTNDQLTHHSPNEFADDLRADWKNVHSVCKGNAQMVIRFGGINDRNKNLEKIIKASLENSWWKTEDNRSAGTAKDGKRQAEQISTKKSIPLDEKDVIISSHE